MGRARGALGLRGRIAGAVFLSAVVTLAVAAVALLGPLEHSLRNAERSNRCRSELHKQRPASTFARLDLCQIVTNPHGEQQALGRAESKLASADRRVRSSCSAPSPPAARHPWILPRKGDNEDGHRCRSATTSTTRPGPTTRTSASRRRHRASPARRSRSPSTAGGLPAHARRYVRRGAQVDRRDPRPWRMSCAARSSMPRSPRSRSRCCSASRCRRGWCGGCGGCARRRSMPRATRR